MGKYFRPTILTLFYLLSNFIAIILILALLMIFNYDSFDFTQESPECGSNYVELVSPYTFLIYIISGVLTLALARVVKMTDFKGAFSCKDVNWSSAWIPVLGIIFIMYAFDLLLSDILGVSSTLKMQNDSNINQLLGTFGGMLSLLVAPIMEELIFREAIIKSMLSNGATAKQAIIFSAICYSVTCIYPYYIIFRFLLGIFLAIVYVKTRSIVLSYIIAVVLTSVSIVIKHVFGIEDSILGFPIYYDLALLLLLVYPAYLFLRYYWNEPLPSEKNAELEKLVSR